MIIKELTNLSRLRNEERGKYFTDIIYKMEGKDHWQFIIVDQRTTNIELR